MTHTNYKQKPLKACKQEIQQPQVKTSVICKQDGCAGDVCAWSPFRVVVENIWFVCAAASTEERSRAEITGFSGKRSDTKVCVRTATGEDFKERTEARRTNLQSSLRFPASALPPHAVTASPLTVVRRRNGADILWPCKVAQKPVGLSELARSSEMLAVFVLGAGWMFPP